jgi:hypothetical protein
VIRLLLAAAFVLSLPLDGSAAPKAPLRIYLHTRQDSTGFVDAEQQRRMDSVRDLRGVIDKDTKHFQPVLVDSPTEADLEVEVVSSAREDRGDRTGVHVGFGVVTSKKSTKPIVRAVVRVGAYSTEIASRPKVSSWKMAAADWQREFRKWVNANSPRLLAGSPSTSNGTSRP